MAEQIYMDVPAVRDISQNFGNISETLNTVSSVLDMLSMTLKASAFIGMVGNAAVALFIDTINPHIQNMAEKCEEISKDVSNAANAYERGDERGATKFH